MLTLYVWYQPSTNTARYPGQASFNVKLTPIAPPVSAAAVQQSKAETYLQSAASTQPNHHDKASTATTTWPHIKTQIHNKSDTTIASNTPDDTLHAQQNTTTDNATTKNLESNDNAMINANPTTGPVDEQLISNIVQHQLRSHLAPHFNYPRLAQRRNWQGEVRLGIRIEADGRLNHIRVIQSSGYAILDNAALHSVRSVSNLPDAAQWLHGHYHDTVIPVEYRLTES